MPLFTGKICEVLYVSTADCTALASFTSEASLLAGPKKQPTFAGQFWGLAGSNGTAIRIRCWGVLGTTGTPTYTWTVRSNTTQGDSNLAGTKLLESAAITTSSGVSTKIWVIEAIVSCNTYGQGTGNCTLNCAGTIRSPGGFASPFEYVMNPSSAESATHTTTIDGALTQYLNVSVTCSASSASNTVTCKGLVVENLSGGG